MAQATPLLATLAATPDAASAAVWWQWIAVAIIVAAAIALTIRRSIRRIIRRRTPTNPACPTTTPSAPITTTHGTSAPSCAGCPLSASCTRRP